MRKHLIMPADWWSAIESAAAKRGQHVSEWIAAACAAQLPERVARKLSERPKRGRPKRVTPELG